VNLESIMMRVAFMSRFFGKYDLRYIVKMLLMELGIPPHTDGFKFLICGIVYLYEHPGAKMTRDVYPAIAAEYGGRSTHVEIAMRRTIWQTWKVRRGNWQDYFPDRRKPTNSEFMSDMVQILSLLEQYQYETMTEGDGTHV